MNQYSSRRNRVLNALPENSALMLFSGRAPMRSEDESYPFSVNRSFYYLTGLDKEVRDYVFSTEQANGLYDRIREVLKFSVPLYEKEGKAQLVVAFGCTGGQHRSTAFAYRMQQEFEQEWDNVKMTCRDMSMNQHEVKNR